MLWRLIFCLLLTSARGTSTYAYDAVGNLDHVIDPNGLAHAYRYTEQNRLRLLELTNASGTLIQSYTYALNRSGMRTGVTESNLVSGTAVVRRSASYEYDQNYASGATPARVYRLTRENLFNSSGSAAGVITHVYDLVGNRTSRTTTGLTPVDAMPDQTGLTFNARDLITGTYDANGNSTAYETGTTTGDVYDAENRLIARSTTITVGYDSDGNRVKKTVSGTTTYYLVDDLNPTGYAQVLAEWSDTSHPPDRAYTPGSELIAQRRNTGSTSSPTWTVSYYGYDGQGSIRLLTDSSTTPTVTDTYDYDAYGQLLATSGSTPNAYRYTGQQWDADLGMYYLRARYYQPNQGRFWTMDTYEGDQQDPLSLHKYLYSYGNPANVIDPSGRDGIDTLMVVNFASAVMNGSSLVADMRAKNYAAAMVDGLGLAASLFGLGGPTSGFMQQYATVNGVLANSAQIAARAQILQGLTTALGAVTAGWNVMRMAGPGNSGAGSSAGATVGNSSASSNPVDGVINETLNQRGHFTSKYTLSATEALTAGMNWLGTNVKELGQAGSGVFYNSSTGHRFRIDLNSLAGNHRPNVPHVHFELIDPATGKVLANNHVPFVNN